ncbi:MAG TPA: glycine oxidase ThiO [Ktedonobacteraceae bacterium]|nr:glycine oxidase ThiO [Ktedonobacteraceae bacterium]
MFTQPTSDVVIVGGGVIGCSIAYHLRKAGIGVTVIDQGEIGAEASSAAAGLLAPLGSLAGPGPFADLLLASFALFPTLVPELEDVSGIRVEYERTGALRVVRNPKNVSNLRKRMKAWQPLGLQMRWLTGEEARQLEPTLAPDVCAALYAPEESQVRASQVVKAFGQAAANLGATLLSHTRITGIQQQHGRVTALTTSQGESITCHHLVVATGAWAAQWSEWLHIQLAVVPQRGQILALRQPAPPLRHIIFGEAAYLAPKQDSTVVVGATKEEVGFDKQLTAGGVAWLLSTANRLIPSLEQSAIERMWAGLRPKTPDNLPILGTAPGWENVTLATGHGSVGIMLSAITGQTLAELLVTGAAPKLIRPFALERPADLNAEDAHGEW